MLAQLFPQLEAPGDSFAPTPWCLIWLVLMRSPELLVQLELFSGVMLERMRKTDLLEDVRRLFKAFDLRSEGFISLQSFQQVRTTLLQRICMTNRSLPCQIWTKLLPRASEATMLQMFRAADRDGDGRVRALSSLSSVCVTCAVLTASGLCRSRTRTLRPSSCWRTNSIRNSDSSIQSLIGE